MNKRLLYWNNTAHRNIYIQQIADFLNKKRIMRPQTISVLCWWCGERNVYTRRIDRHHFACELCAYKVQTRRNNYCVPIQKHKIVKVKGRKPRKIFDREYRRMWYRKKYARFNDVQLLQQRTRWQKWAEKNNYKRPSQKGDTWYCVKRRAWARQQAVKAKWFRPIRKRLLINDKR